MGGAISDGEEAGAGGGDSFGYRTATAGTTAAEIVDATMGDIDGAGGTAKPVAQREVCGGDGVLAAGGL